MQMQSAAQPLTLRWTTSDPSQVRISDDGLTALMNVRNAVVGPDVECVESDAAGPPPAAQCLRLRVRRHSGGAMLAALRLDQQGSSSLFHCSDGDLLSGIKRLSNGPRWDEADRDYELQVSGNSGSHSPAASAPIPRPPAACCAATHFAVPTHPLMPPPLQVEVDWIRRVVRWSVDGGSAVAVPVPADWTRGGLCLGLYVLDRCRCTVMLLESIVIPASPLQLALSVGSSASGSTKGRHAAATAAASSALRASSIRSPPRSLCQDELSHVSLRLLALITLFQFLRPTRRQPRPAATTRSARAQRRRRRPRRSKVSRCGRPRMLPSDAHLLVDAHSVAFVPL
jgi:hypothetical protein